MSEKVRCKDCFVKPYIMCFYAVGKTLERVDKWEGQNIDLIEEYDYCPHYKPTITKRLDNFINKFWRKGAGLIKMEGGRK
jgi:hypothetical protein